MRTAIVLLAVAGLGAAGYFKWKRAQAREDAAAYTASVQSPAAHYRGRWVQTPPFRGIQIDIPEEFTRRPHTDHKEGQRLFVGPAADGSPTIQLYTGPERQPRSLLDWHRWWTGKYDFDSPVRRMKVLDEGRATIAERPCRWFLCEEVVNGKRSLLFQFSFVSKNAEHFIRGHAPDSLFSTGGFRETMERVRRSARLVSK